MLRGRAAKKWLGRGKLNTERSRKKRQSSKHLPKSTCINAVHLNLHLCVCLWVWVCAARAAKKWLGRGKLSTERSRKKEL